MLNIVSKWDESFQWVQGSGPFRFWTLLDDAQLENLGLKLSQLVIKKMKIPQSLIIKKKAKGKVFVKRLNTVLVNTLHKNWLKSHE